MIKQLNKQTKIGIGIILAVATVIVGYFFYSSYTPDGAPVEGSEKTVTNEEYGIVFTYTEGEEAFTLVEPPVNQAGIQKSYVLLPTKAYNEYKESEDVREAPAGIQLFMLTLEEENTEAATATERADRMTRLKDWAVRFDGLTQYSQKKAEPEVVEIDGVKALKYQADGLYQQTIYLATYKNTVYMFVSQYNEPSDVTYTAFENLLASVRFE